MRRSCCSAADAKGSGAVHRTEHVEVLPKIVRRKYILSV